MKKGVVLLSGGIDSTVTLAIAKEMGFDIYAISFDYKQRHNVELSCAKRVANFYKVKKHNVVEIDLRAFGGSALTSDIKVPKNRKSEEIPVTYVPARNTIFLSFALGWAEVIDSSDIFIGVNVMDYSGYPDCTPRYIKSFEEMANLGTKKGVEGKGHFKLHTPLSTMKKSEIIKKGREVGVDFKMTHSCYDPDIHGQSCGTCDACLIRKRGFVEAMIEDPTKYYE